MLMTTTLMLPSDGYGDVIFTRHDSDGGGYRITCEHADPRIRISDVIVDQIASGGLVPEASMTLPDGTPATKAPGTPLSLLGAVITFACANRRLVYRITGWEPVWLEGDAKRGSYLAEWPD
jgi:hypothetical protein